MPRFSAYLSIYEDWDFLGPSIESIAPLIDELVVVDGAYRWMSNYVRANGKEPTRSSSQVYDILSRLGVPTKIISGLWEDEFEKRAAGYAACEGDFVFRIDSDEIVFANKRTISDFAASGGAVAEMEIPPICHTPNFVQGDPNSNAIPRVGFLFNRKLVDPRDHLRYLWIVSNKRDEPDLRPLHTPYADPVARTAHLTAWRSPYGAQARASFYNLSYFRNYGCPWLPSLRGKGDQDLAEFFRLVDPRQYAQSLLSGAICISDEDMTNKHIVPAPFTYKQRSSIQPYYDYFIKSHQIRNRNLLDNWNWIPHGDLVRIDLSTAEAVEAVTHENRLQLEFSSDVVATVAALHSIIAEPPYVRQIPIRAEIAGKDVTLHIPGPHIGDDALRTILRLHAQCNYTGVMIQYRAKSWAN